METNKQSNLRKAFAKATANEIGEIPEVKHPKVRSKCERSLYDFILNYCSSTCGFFKTKPSARMIKIIERLQSAVISGGRIHLKIARGHGKTSLVKAAVLFAIVYGYRRFVVAVSARKSDASAMIDDIFNLIEDCDSFADDFPEISFPIRRLGGIMQRAANQTYHGVRTKISKSSDRIIMPSLAGYRMSGAIIVARGFKGAARGLIRGSNRPDIVIFDDLQDDKVARNERVIGEYDETIEKSFMGLGGHDRQIAALMTSTPILPNDLSDVFSKKRNWQTFTFPMIVSFPTCYKSENDLWRQYFDIRQDAIAAGEPEHLASNAFYKTHRADMDAGSEVLNPKFYDADTEISGIQHAMNMIFANGEDAFSAEYQMEPVSSAKMYDLSAQLVASRVRKGLGSLVMPEGSVFVAVTTDLNPSYGLSSVAIAFDRFQTGTVVWYDVHKTAIEGNTSSADRAGRLYAELAAVGRDVKSVIVRLGVKSFTYGIDAGFDTAVVRRFVANGKSVCGISSIAMFGKSSKDFNPNVKSRIRAARGGTVLCGDERGRWINWNADMLRETSQRAWLSEVGAPGGLSLFDGGRRHGDFAAQVSAERLIQKVSAGGKTFYTWGNSSKKHDFGDCVAMCYALAADFGITENNSITPVRKRPKPVKGRYSSISF